MSSSLGASGNSGRTGFISSTSPNRDVEKARDIVKTFVEKGEVTEEEMQSFVNDLEQEQDRGEKEEDKDKDKDGEEQGE